MEMRSEEILHIVMGMYIATNTLEIVLGFIKPLKM